MDAREQLIATVYGGGEEAVGALNEYLDRRVEMLDRVTDAFLKRGERWIPVSERLPESGETVLVWHYGEVQMAWLNHLTNGVAYFVRDTHYNFEPSHWMPLPEPPEVK